MKAQACLACKSTYKNSGFHLVNPVRTDTTKTAPKTEILGAVIGDELERRLGGGQDFEFRFRFWGFIFPFFEEEDFFGFFPIFIGLNTNIYQDVHEVFKPA